MIDVFLLLFKQQYLTEYNYEYCVSGVGVYFLFDNILINRGIYIMQEGCINSSNEAA